jgi:4-amino-4-deoxy-L-arabinose transferase-like glycosyltransferase
MAARGMSAFWRSLAGVVVLALAVRLAVYVLVGRATGGLGDFLFFHLQANLIATGHGWLEPFDHAYGIDHGSAGHPPLWPLALAVPSLLGLDSVDAHRAFGLVLGCVVVVLVALVARRLAGPRAGLAAALIAAISPVLVGADGSLLSETLYGAWVLLALLAALALAERPRARTALALGVLGGLAALTRGEGVLLVACVALAALLSAPGGLRGHLRLLAVVAAGSVVTIAPWTLRNHAVLGAWVPISTNDSTVLAGANCPTAYRGANMGGWDLGCIDVPERPYRDEAALARGWRSDGVDYARHHAGRLLVVLPIRALRTFDLWQPRRQTLFAEGQDRRVAEAAVVSWLLVVPFALWGLVLLRRRGGPWLILAAVPAALLLTSLVGYGAPRFRHPVDLVAIVAAGCVVGLTRRQGAAGTPRGSSA